MSCIDPLAATSEQGEAVWANALVRWIARPFKER